jgi:2-C-methyl-D-erythritol 2,4-cyclodiphosphate synthase
MIRVSLANQPVLPTFPLCKEIAALDLRVGHGHDTHRLSRGRKLIIGGVLIDFERGLVGHSDADVLLHAITDALFGAAGLGDIGEWFSDRDPKWAGADSAFYCRRPSKRLPAGVGRS